VEGKCIDYCASVSLRGHSVSLLRSLLRSKKEKREKRGKREQRREGRERSERCTERKRDEKKATGKQAEGKDRENFPSLSFSFSSLFLSLTLSFALCVAHGELFGSHSLYKILSRVYQRRVCGRDSHVLHVRERERERGERGERGRDIET
jgi:hypothetical protein